MKESLKKIWHGFLFGIGLGVAWWGVTYFASIQLTENLSNRVEALNKEQHSKFETLNVESEKKPISNDGIPTLVPLKDDSKIEIVSSNTVNAGFGIEIVGTLKNSGEKEYRSIELEAELFDTEGNFIYECSEYVHEALPSGGSLNFKVSCNPMGKELMKSYASYKLKIPHAGVLR